MAEGKFAGKRLLVLGSNQAIGDVIDYVREGGCHVIVADYLPYERSLGKQLADEHYPVSTADLDALEAIARDRHVDVVFSPIHEFNRIQAMRLSERLGLPFYCTQRQWNLVEHKDQFRTLCERHGVPCPKTWYAGPLVPVREMHVERYPVVVKPVDSSASRGVYVCESQAELEASVQLSVQASASGRIIVEEFVEGYEFTLHYTVCRGHASLSCVDNRYPVKVHEGNVTTIPAGRVYPSLFTEEFVRQVDPAMRRLVEDVGMSNGVLFAQGLYDPDKGTFSLFEAGLRSAAERPYRLIREANGVDYLRLILDVALLGEDAAPLTWDDDPTMHGKALGCVSFVARHGVVGRIEGLDEALRTIPSIVEHECRYPVGSETPDTDTLRQLMLRFFMVCEGREQMVRDVETLNGLVNVYDEQGRDMAIKLDPSRLFALD